MAVEAAVSFAVETLGNFLIEKAVFLKGVEGDVEWLRNELKRMQCFQKDAARKQGKSESIRNWISEIREVAHDAADAIEMFVLNVETREQQKGRCAACFHPDHVHHLNRVGKEIDSIRKRLKDIEDSRLRYGIQDVNDHERAVSTERSLQVESWRRLAYWQTDKDVVGLEEDVEELVEKLLRISILEEEKRVKAERKRERERRRKERERRRQWKKKERERDKERKGEEEEAEMKDEEEEEESEKEEEEGKEEEEVEERKGHSVAAVVGMGGIGKSTLASRIYHHPAVADRFESRAWVVVSSEFTLEDIIKQIMHQLGIPLYHRQLLESMNDQLRRQEILQEQLHNELNGKLYFIVLDDMWETQHWESLRRAFPQDRASRLMLTSRNQVMTRYSDDCVHAMKLLDANRSWKLFLRKAFIDNSDGKCPEELKDIGEEILKKCDGLPLAISVVGGLLLRKTPCRSEWLKVLNDMKSHMDRNRGEIDTISAILELSYQNLLPELKACFLCLGFFKEDAVIKAKSLVHIWVAQDLVQQKAVEETMEDVARDYLNELISRNMVQVKERTYDQVKACHMHDLLRDLCLRKAKEEIDFEVLTEEGAVHSHNNQSSPREPRHRALYSTRLSVLNSTRNQHVRSLFVHGEIGLMDRSGGGGQPSYWKSFELLRVLDLGNARFQEWPKAIGGLIGLRYLKMVYVGFEPNLPRSWAKLKNLQVLDLGLGSGFEIFISDKVILEMDRLRHLYAFIRSYSNIPLGNLRNLQTLCWFLVRDWNLWQVTKMTGVTKLGIDMRHMSDASTLFTNLGALENLVNLSLIYHVSKNLDGLNALHRVTRLKLVTMSLPRNSLPTSLTC